MKKKITKIIIFIIIMFLVIGTVCYRTIFVCNNEKLENITYKSNNLIIQEINKGNTENKDLIILGSGYSLTVNANDKIIEHDPLMIMPKNNFFEETVLSVFFPFESNGLEEAGRELAEFINVNEHNYDSVTLIGLSKCGVCFANATKWITNKKKITIITISAPFKGTDKAQIAKEKLNFFEKFLFLSIYSNHNVDQDLIPNSKFMQNADYSGLADCKKHINIISICPKKTNNYLDNILCYLDKKLEINGDGIISFDSQKILYPNTIEIQIEATHAYSMQKGIEMFLSEKEGSSIKSYHFILTT